MTLYRDCPDCGGDGSFGRDPCWHGCHRCEGRGVVPLDEAALRSDTTTPSSVCGSPENEPHSPHCESSLRKRRRKDPSA